MLLVKDLRENPDKIKAALSKRCNDALLTYVDQAIALDQTRRETQAELDDTLAQQKKISQQIGILMRDGKKDEVEKIKAEVSDLKSKSQELKQKLNDAETSMQEVLYQIPNTPHSTVKAGKSEEDNEIVSEWGEIPKLPESALPHWDLAEKYDLINFELGVKITGTGFPVYSGKGARLQRALINFFLDQAHRAGYKEVIPPLVVNEDSGYGTGQLPDKEGQMYHIQNEDFYLIPTAEVPITNIYRDEILKSSDLPIKVCGYTPCFRREAGSYGKDVRGLNRLHQFDKVEIVQIANPENSYSILDEMVNHVKGLLEKLELPYRILRLCGGDLGFAAAITYDFEVYSTAQQKWLEVSSVSNFETYQSNRLKCRFRPDDEKSTTLVHTLNGSAMALPRILAALLENNQTENSIEIPKVLQPYTNFEKIN